MDKAREELERIAKLLAQANEQVNLWTIRKLKYEGAVEVLQKLAEEEGKPDFQKKDEQKAT